MAETPTLKVLRDIESPPGGWQYTCPETGHTLRANFMKTLYPMVRQHYLANDLFPPDREEVEHVACGESHGAERLCGKKAPVQPAPGMPHLTPALLTRFLRSVWESLKAGKLVSVEEAARRYEICRSCPLATSVGFCEGCSGIGRLVEIVLPKNPLPDDPEKRWCRACGCHCRTKVFLKNSALDKAETVRPLYWEGCWRLEANRVSDDL